MKTKIITSIVSSLLLVAVIFVFHRTIPPRFNGLDVAPVAIEPVTTDEEVNKNSQYDKGGDRWACDEEGGREMILVKKDSTVDSLTVECDNLREVNRQKMIRLRQGWADAKANEKTP